MQFSVIFTRPKKWNPWSWALGKIEGTPESHCAILFKSDDFGRHMILHSKMFNVHMIPFEEFCASSEIVSAHAFNCTDDEKKQALEAISSDIGGPYSYLQLPTMLMGRIFGLSSSFDDPGMTCTELVAKFLHSGIIKESNEMQFCDYGLKEVRGLVEKHGKLI